MQTSHGTLRSINKIEDFLVIANVVKGKKSDQNDCRQFKKCLKEHSKAYCQLKFDLNHKCYEIK